MNRRELLTATAAVAGATLASRAAFAAPGDGIVHGGMAGRDYAPAVAAVRAYAEQHRAAHSIPGMTIAMVDRDGFVGLIHSGLADVDQRVAVGPDHLFQIGSISKQLAALCAFRLRAMGRIDFGAEVAGLLPGAGVPAGITLAHLLEHSSGLADDVPLFARATGGRLWQAYEPRTHWSYSNTGYDLIGKCIERATGRPFEAVVRELAFVPLGMDAAQGAIRGKERARYAEGYRPYVADRPWADGDRLGVSAWVDMTFASGCVAATGRNMARYLAWLTQASAGRGAPLLSDADARAFTTATIDAAGWAGGGRYGNGLATVVVDGRTMLHHTGGMIAFSSSMHVDPAAGVACFASTNIGSTEYRPRDVTILACEWLRAVREGGASPVARPVRAVFEKAGDYAGRYSSADGLFEMSLDGDRLRASSNGRVHRSVSSPGADVLLIDGFGRYLLKAERSGGRVIGLWSGETYYARDGAEPMPPAPPELAVIAGRYDNDDPWRGTARLVARHDGLWLDGITPMVRRDDGSWRVGADDWSPERAWFDAPMGGRPQRLSLSGADYLRRADV